MKKYMSPPPARAGSTPPTSSSADPNDLQHSARPIRRSHAASVPTLQYVSLRRRKGVKRFSHAWARPMSPEVMPMTWTRRTLGCKAACDTHEPQWMPKG